MSTRHVTTGERHPLGTIGGSGRIHIIDLAANRPICRKPEKPYRPQDGDGGYSDTAVASQVKLLTRRGEPTCARCRKLAEEGRSLAQQV